MNVVWIKGVSSTIKSEAKEQKLGFLRMLLGTLGASLLGNLLGGKGTIKAGEGTTRTVEDKIRAGQDFTCNLIPLTNFEIQRYYQNVPKFNGVYSRKNLPKIKDGAVINPD